MVQRSTFNVQCSMSHPLEQLREDALREIESESDEKSLDAVRVRYLGRNGSISAWGEKMKTLSAAERPVIGKLLNEVRNAVNAAIEERAEKFRAQKESDALANIDISLPGTGRSGYSGYSGHSAASTGYS